MRSENYVHFWTNPYIKLYTLCMADIVMLYSSLHRSAGGMAGWRVIAWDQAQKWGKSKKRGHSKKKKKKKRRAKRVEEWSARFAHRFIKPFLPTFF